MPLNENLTAERPNFVTHLECGLTGERHEAGVVQGLSAAGKPLLVRYDLASLGMELSRDEIESRPGDIWRWRELLPVRDAANIVSLGEADTPIIPLDAVAQSEGVAAGNLLVKDEGRLPTGSFKARGLVMAISMAKELGITSIAMPTNGNAGAAAAAYATRAGIEATIFCPDDTPEVNVREIAAQGAKVYRVNGLIDDCGKLVREGATEKGWFDLSTLKEPYRIEGKKTMGLELAEQFGWKLPDVIFYPTGGGTGLIGMWKAFAELKQLGWVDGPMPRMFAVQAEGCAPMVRAWEQGERFAERWQDAHTVAAGIRVPQAVGDFLILDAVRESGGRAVAVSDAEIERAVDDAASKDGLLLCPEGGATLAAWRQALAGGWVDKGERALLFNCATGLKYPLSDNSRTLDRHAEIDYSTL
ncbi:MAG TPA: threonine synthase [Sphingorhabdus sp.]|nr:threonine synthase [Sphingorhabdus sp.]